MEGGYNPPKHWTATPKESGHASKQAYCFAGTFLSWHAHAVQQKVGTQKKNDEGEVRTQVKTVTTSIYTASPSLRCETAPRIRCLQRKISSQRGTALCMIE